MKEHNKNKRGKVVLHSVALDIYLIKKKKALDICNSQQEWERIKEPRRKIKIKINKEHTKKCII